MKRLFGAEQKKGDDEISPPDQFMPLCFYLYRYVFKGINVRLEAQPHHPSER